MHHLKLFLMFVYIEFLSFFLMYLNIKIKNCRIGNKKTELLRQSMNVI